MTAILGGTHQNLKKNLYKSEFPVYYFPSCILRFNLRGLWSLIVLWIQTAKTPNTDLPFLARGSGRASVSHRVLGASRFLSFSLLLPPKNGWNYPELCNTVKSLRKPFIRLEELGKEGIWELESVSRKGELEKGIMP